MNRNILTFLAFVLMIGASHAQPETFTTSILVHGSEVSCRAANGKTVPLQQTDKAIQTGGGFASINAAGEMAIFISPTVLNSMTKMSALFLFYHECAHLALPYGIGLGSPDQESAADCHAASEMKKHGLITSWLDFSAAMQDLKKSNPSSSGHLPGPERVRLAAKCVKIPLLNASNSTCKTLDQFFSKGKGNLATFNRSMQFGGFGCTSHDDGTRLVCFRDITSKVDRDAVAGRMIEEIRQCLPDSFESRRSTSRPDYTVFFENKDTGHYVSIRSEYTDTVRFDLELR